jgi:predicted RNA-binding Zn-ribbon protein involved in translation (DUF1610 family)
MPIRNLNSENLQCNEDWEGNNVALTCPFCGKVFIVSAMMHVEQGNKGYRKCPACGKSIGQVSGGKNSGGTASIEW